MKYLLFLFLVLTLISCHKLKEGRVISKEYQPARTWIMFVPMRVGKVTTICPVPMYDGEDWVIEIEGEYKGKKRVETYYIPQTLYDSLKYGSYFCTRGDCDTDDNNNLRTD